MMTTRQLLLCTWDWNPFLIALCIVVLFFFALLCRWKFCGRSFLFIIAVGLFFLALDSPISYLAKGILFSAHMIQHLLLVLIVPALVLLGFPETPQSRPLHMAWFQYPLVPWICGVGAMWVWHIPAFCKAAASNDWTHALQTFSLLVLGGLFWWPILGPRTEERLSPLSGIVYLFSGCIACTLLGIWISFSSVSVCPAFSNLSDPLCLKLPIGKSWPLSPSADQQIGGLLMWVPTCLVYLIAILVLLGRLYGHLDLKKESE